MYFETTVKQGLPIICRITYYEPYKPSIITADPAFSHPPEGPELEYELCWRSGHLLPEKVLNAIHEEELESIELEALKHIANNED